MANPMPPDVKRFRVSIVKQGLLMLFGAFGGIIVGVIWTSVEDGRVNVAKHWHVFEIAFPWLVLTWLVGTLLLYFITIPVGFSAEGVYGASFCGLRRFIRWQDIAEVRRSNTLNLQELKLHSDINREVTTIRMYQAHKQEFLAEIRKFAPPDNPILRFLD